MMTSRHSHCSDAIPSEQFDVETNGIGYGDSDNEENKSKEMKARSGKYNQSIPNRTKHENNESPFHSTETVDIFNTDTANDYNDNRCDSNDFIGKEAVLHNSTSNTTLSNTNNQRNILYNFLLFSILFSLNHGGVVSCISLATARLGGSLSSFESYAFYGSYTLSGLMGVTYAVKCLGRAGKSAVVVGMCIYCAYAGYFALATIIGEDAVVTNGVQMEVIVIVGGLLGGVGSGFLWIAQGSYFTRVSAEYAAASDMNEHRMPSMTMENACKELGGKFAAVYLTGGLVMRIFSNIVVTILGWSWMTVFLGYIFTAIVSTIFMYTSIAHYGNMEEEKCVHTSAFKEFTSMLRLLWRDRKIKHILPFCAVFALTSSFVAFFVNGEVPLHAITDTNKIYVELLRSVPTITAAAASILFARLAQWTGNGVVLVVGCVSFVLTGLLFLVKPDLEKWGVGNLLVVYGLQGIGRATFEGNLRAEFAVMFVRDKESAFANIVFWNGLFCTISSLITANFGCHNISTYCIKKHDESLHNILIYGLLVSISAVLVILGLSRVLQIKKAEETSKRRLTVLLNFSDLWSEEL